MHEKWRPALRFFFEDSDDGLHHRFWLFVTVLFWVATQITVSKEIAGAYPDIIQDDARQYVVWLRRFSEPGIYPNDPIAEHFLAVTPWLYKALYWPFGKLGFDPLLVHPLILLPAMAVLWSVVCFTFIHRLWPTPAGAAIATLALSYMLQGQPAALGLPKGVQYSGVLLLMLCFLDRRVAFTGIAVLAVWGLYPVAAIVAVVAMGILVLRPCFPFVTKERAAWLTLIAAGAGTIFGASLFLASTNKAGPTISVQEARELAIFARGGRTEYFNPSFTSFYVCNRRAGLLGPCHDVGLEAIKQLVVLLAVVAGGIWLVGSGRASSLFVRFGLPPPDLRLAAVIGALAISGLILFTLAHAFAFRLYLPNRYARLTLGLDYALVIAIVTSAVILILVRRIVFLDKVGFATVSVLGILLVAYFAFCLEQARRVKFVQTDAQEIYARLRATREDTLVGGFSLLTDSVPAFGRRSVLGSQELMFPYKKANFELIAGRMTKLAHALYAPAAKDFADLSRDYKINYVLINRDGANEVKDLEKWAKSLPQLNPTIAWLKGGGRPFFWDLTQSCESAGTATHVLLDAACLQSQTSH
jgi:hypothetical protein